jgi:outer membrane protein, heavy metal efflux system
VLTGARDVMALVCAVAAAWQSAAAQIDGPSGAGISASSSHTRAAAVAGDSQLPTLTRAAAVEMALTGGTHVALARADSLVARATLRAAREYPNPVANLTYSRDEPHYHGVLSLPFDYPWVRKARVRAADAGFRSAAYRYAFEQATVRFEVDTLYTRALAAVAHERVSRHNALDADSLRRLAVIRRDAGDASDMDVDLAAVNAGQQLNVAAADSLAAIGTLLDLQAVLGLPADHQVVVLGDSLQVPDAGAGAGGGSADPPAGGAAPASARAAATAAPGSSTVPLQVAAAQATLESEESNLSVARRTVLAQPAIQAGLEGGDPTQRFLLPTVGLSIPFPLFNRGAGEIGLATASRDRAVTELEVARRQSAAEAAQAQRELAVATARADRDRNLLALAERVVARSLTAFAEGATALPSVLEAQRSARDALNQYVDDLAAANLAAASVRLFTLTAPSR